MGGRGVEEWWVGDRYDAGDDATWDGVGFKSNGNTGSLKDVAIYIRHIFQRPSSDLDLGDSICRALTLMNDSTQSSPFSCPLPLIYGV